MPGRGSVKRKKPEIVVTLGFCCIIAALWFFTDWVMPTKDIANPPSLQAEVFTIGNTIKIKTDRGEIKNGIFELPLSNQSSQTFHHKHLGEKNYRTVSMKPEDINKIREFLKKYGTIVAHTNMYDYFVIQ